MGWIEIYFFFLFFLTFSAHGSGGSSDHQQNHDSAEITHRTHKGVGPGQSWTFFNSIFVAVEIFSIANVSTSAIPQNHEH